MSRVRGPVDEKSLRRAIKVGRFLLNLPNRIYVKGRPKVGEKEFDQKSRVGKVWLN